MTNPNKKTDCEDCSISSALVRRRDFLQSTAMATTTMLLADLFGDRASAQESQLETQVATYPRQKIGELSDLDPRASYDFEYPEGATHAAALLFQLVDRAGKPRVAGGAVGRDKNIVAFSALCTHMGADMSDGFIKQYGLLGCSEHLTTYDLTRHGIVVAGHATTALPQVLLEIEGDDIFAVGISGLLYGHVENPRG